MSFRRLENTVKKTAGLTSKLGSSKFQTGPNSQLKSKHEKEE